MTRVHNFHQRSFSGRHNFRNNSRSRFARPNPSRNQGHVQYVNKVDPAVAAMPHEPILHKFSDFAVDERIKINIARRGYSVPTPIQDRTIPLILEGKDVIGLANTGTGKTAAFIIPILHKIVQNRNERALIIVPTRELAYQIEEEFRAFSRDLNIYSLLCIGGASINRQIMALRQNPNVIISTPGRLLDLIKNKLLFPSQFNTIVLDEVDRMVDIGFIRDIKLVISLLPKIRQSLFFSATLSPDLNSIVHSFLNNPVTISVAKNPTAEKIDQDVIRVKDKNEKIEKLESMLRQQEFTKVIIFGRTKWGVERLSKSLQEKGFSTASIHGNKSQNQRIRALTQFKQNRLQVLVATDIASRGLDIDDVSHVINFDEPSTQTDYIHRIGRTGRANKQGKAITFIG